MHDLKKKKRSEYQALLGAEATLEVAWPHWPRSEPRRQWQGPRPGYPLSAPGAGAGGRAGLACLSGKGSLTSRRLLWAESTLELLWGRRRSAGPARGLGQRVLQPCRGGRGQACSARHWGGAQEARGPCLWLLFFFCNVLDGKRNELSDKFRFCKLVHWEELKYTVKKDFQHTNVSFPFFLCCAEILCDKGFRFQLLQEGSG